MLCGTALDLAPHKTQFLVMECGALACIRVAFSRWLSEVFWGLLYGLLE